jgi:sterol desaturase/sphingolipid hydroxylase (fatty acid hydroxylase superfamily)
MIRVRFDEFPDYNELVLQVAFAFALDDFFSFWGHRMSHSSPEWYKIHKVHHEYDSLFTFATEYSHPL